jgi:Ca2+-binding RTX toxin-like protein
MAPVGRNPLPPIKPSGLEVALEEVVTLPATADSGPSARIQQVVQAGDGSNRFYALDTRGVVWVVQDGEVATKPFLDLRSLDIGFVEPGAEAGLRSIAFHPDFERPGSPGFGKLYTVHSAAPASAQPGVQLFHVPLEGPATEVLFHDVVTEWTVVNPSNPTEVEASSRRELFRIEEAATTHNLNQILFDPNARPGDEDYGLLYTGVGDGGNYFALGFPGDPNDLAQDPSQIQGKILRIDPLRQADGSAYGIPEDNPFIGEAAHLPEIWALGFRNPQTLAFDTAGGGRLFVGEIGQRLIEEINIVLPGENYGWNEREGTFVYQPGGDVTLPPDDARFGYQYPFSHYDHDEIGGNNPFERPNAAIAGGFVYRGSAIPELYGQYIFADLTTGRIFHVPVASVEAALKDGLISPEEALQPSELALRIDAQIMTMQQISGDLAGRVDLRFGMDEDGELYIFSKQTGTVWQLGLTGERTTGTSAAEQFEGTPRSDVIRGEDGADEIHGHGGNDMLFGGAGNDHIHGGPGQDRLLGGNANDILIGGAGIDLAVYTSATRGVLVRLDTGLPQDTLGAGRDRLEGIENLGGSQYDDVLIGNGNSNHLIGYRGNDRLVGGRGNDFLTGGAGVDEFYFRPHGGTDRISDFEVGRELIALEGFGTRFDTPDEVLAEATQIGDDTYITLANQDGSGSTTVLLAKTDLADLDPSIFVFIG